MDDVKFDMEPELENVLTNVANRILEPFCAIIIGQP